MEADGVLLDAVSNHVRRAWRHNRRRAARLGARVSHAAETVSSWAATGAGRLAYACVDVRACPACGSVRTTPLAACDAYTDRFDLRRRIAAKGCRRCGLLFASPLPPRRAVAARYEREGAWGSAHATRGHVRKKGRLLQSLDEHIGLQRPPGSAAVLDVGCGGGRWLNTLGRFGWQTFGIEPSTKVAFRTHRELAAVPRTPAFDLVILSYVLEHVRHPGRMLKDCARALKPGGWLYVAVPNLDSLPHHQDWYYCLNGRVHLMAYSSACLQHLFARAGLAWHACLDDPRAADNHRAATSRMHVLARKPANAGAMGPPPPPNPLAAARRALVEAGLLGDASRSGARDEPGAVNRRS